MSKPTVEKVKEALEVLMEANGGINSGNMIYIALGNGVILQGVATGIDRVPQAILDMTE